MSNPTTPDNPYKSDVLRSKEHSELSPEAIAKAVQRHNREHPKKVQQPMKTAPRS